MNSSKLDVVVQAELDEQMQEGYRLSMEGDCLASSRVWLDLWRKITSLMEQQEYTSIEKFEKDFQGLQSIYNWTSDFELEMETASRKDRSFAQMRIDFCAEYLTKSENTLDYNHLNKKRAIAESYFFLGNSEEGDRLFEQLVAEHPEHAWGWIGWSDQYGLFAEKQNKNYEKAVYILTKALDVDGMDDRFDVLERLIDVYEEMGMKEQAAELKELMVVEGEESTRKFKLSSAALSAARTIAPVKSEKINRNAPCPCGSGKKYKKCCGK